MTATQAPTPGPLSASDVKLLVTGDLLRHKKYGLAHFYDACGGRGEGWVIVECHDGKDAACRPENLFFIGRPDESGWMPWSGETKGPVDGTDMVCDFIMSDGREYLGQKTPRFWHLVSKWRPSLAPTAPVEASGSERVVPVCHEIPLSNHMKVTLEYDPDGSRTAMLWNEANEPIADGDAPDLAALRPQPSGETRKDYDRNDVRYGLQLIADEECDEVAASYYAKKALALLSATTPALAEAQDEDTPCTDCGDTGVTHQTERRCSCQEAEAQDEGAAGERKCFVGEGDVAKANIIYGPLSREYLIGVLADRDLEIATLLSARPSPTPAADALDELNAAWIREGKLQEEVEALRSAPAADADRVRIAVEALETARGHTQLTHVYAGIDQALAALKSEGK